MTKIPVFIVDAFTATTFCGNPAAVCLLNESLEDDIYPKIAAEFNLPVTAFLHIKDASVDNFQTASRFFLRWFTATTELPLCGHGTLASSHIIFNNIGNTKSEVVFEINGSSGELTVFRSAENPGCLTMNFPQHKLLRLPLLTWKDEFRPNDFEQGVTPPVVTHDLLNLATGDHRPAAMVYVVKYKVLLIALEDTTRATFESITVPVEQLKKFDPDGQYLSGIILTVRGTTEGGFVDERGIPYDFASRFFPPWLGLSEDPATGSAHCCLGPFWKTVLGKNQLYARQCFPSRGADFRLELPDQERIHLIGQAITVFKGELIL